MFYKEQSTAKIVDAIKRLSIRLLHNLVIY